MKSINFKVISKGDVENIVKTANDKLSAELYEQLNKLLERVNNLEHLFRLYNGKIVKN